MQGMWLNAQGVLDMAWLLVMRVRQDRDQSSTIVTQGAGSGRAGRARAAISGAALLPPTIVFCRTGQTQIHVGDLELHLSPDASFHRPVVDEACSG